MIAGVTIEKGEQFAAGGGVYSLIYLRQTKGFFKAVFVKISVINAYSPFFILFLSEHWVSQPLRMIHLFDKSSC